MSARVLDWHGYSSASPGLDEVALHVGPLPGRESIAVYTITRPVTGGAVTAVLAYCRSEEDGHALLDAIRRLAMS